MTRLKCADCPRWYDPYPGRVDMYGNHPVICKMSGNAIYLESRRERKYNGSGYMYFEPSGCNIYGSPDEALQAMTEPERIFVSEARKCGTQEEIDALIKNWHQIMEEHRKKDMSDSEIQNSYDDILGNN